MSKPRPRTRMDSHNLYMPPAYCRWKEQARRSLAQQWQRPPLAFVQALAMRFRGPAIGDLDNVAGAVLDAGNGVVWVDDRLSVIPAMDLSWQKAKRSHSEIRITFQLPPP